MQDVPNRRRLLAQLAFAGLIDVQDRMLFNRSYTTGHKSYRARATIELGDLIGWDKAHSVIYAGVPDMAVGPRWHSTYEMACNIALGAFEGRDHELLQTRAWAAEATSMPRSTRSAGIPGAYRPGDGAAQGCKGRVRCWT